MPRSANQKGQTNIIIIINIEQEQSLPQLGITWFIVSLNGKKLNK